MKKLTLLLFVAFGSLPCHADQFDAIRKRIRTALVAEQVPSLAVAVAKGNKVLWEEGFGWANREERIKATQHTMYSLASISKPMTSTGLMVLAQRQELSLDDPANQHLDVKLQARVGSVERATLRRLANHTSGLPLHYQFFYADEPYRRPPMAESIRRYGIVMTNPGKHYQYANFGYGVIDHIIARTSRTSYAEFMRREVFLPLGMTHTSVDIGKGLEKFQAVRYGPDQQPIPFYEFDHPGASAIFSSAHDLVRFGMFHLGQKVAGQKQILSERSRLEMQRGTADTGDGREYGVGWSINRNEYGVKTIGHTGSMGGVRTRLTMVPNEKLVVVALCNGQSGLPHRISREILDVMIPKYKTNRHKPPKPRKKPNAKKKQSVIERLMKQVQGRWRGRIYTYRGSHLVSLNIQADGDIHVKIGNGLTTLLNSARIRNGFLTGISTGDINTPDANRRPYHLRWRVQLNGRRITGSVSAVSLRGKRTGNAMSYFVELRRDNGIMFNGLDLDGWRVITKNDFSKHGKVSVKDKQIILDAGKPATGIVWTGETERMNYELTMDAKRVAGDDFFCGLTFPVNKSYCTLIVGGWGGMVTGLSNIDNQSAVENETTDSQMFKKNQWYRIRLRVTPKKIEAWIDKKQIVDLDTKGKKFSIWWEQEPVRPLGVASWYTKAALRNIRIKRLP